MRTYTDEELMAFADGELPAADAQAIAAAARKDALLAQRIAPFADSRRILQDAFGDALRQPVPGRLLEVLGKAAGSGAGASKVVPLPRRGRRGAGWVPMALAASLALAVGLYAGGWLDLRQGPGGMQVAGMPADPAALGRALETLPSGEPLAGEAAGVRYEILPLASLRTAAGAYCREFESSVSGADAPQRARGVACREPDGQWATRAVASLAPDTMPPPAGYVPAAGSAPDLTTALGAAQRLTPDEEARQIQNRWSR